MGLFSRTSKEDRLRRKFNLELATCLYFGNAKKRRQSASKLLDMLHAMADIDPVTALAGAICVAKDRADDRRNKACNAIRYVELMSENEYPFQLLNFLREHISLANPLRSKERIAADIRNLVRRTEDDHPAASLHALAVCLEALPDTSLMTGPIHLDFRRIENNVAARGGTVHGGGMFAEMLNNSSSNSVEQNLETVSAHHPLIALDYLARLAAVSGKSEYWIMGPARIVAHMLPLIERVRQSDPLAALDAAQAIVPMPLAGPEMDQKRYAFWKELAEAARAHDPGATRTRAMNLLAACPPGSPGASVATEMLLLMARPEQNGPASTHKGSSESILRELTPEESTEKTPPKPADPQRPDFKAVNGFDKTPSLPGQRI